MEYNILGKSDCTISILLENLFSIHGKDFKINIIENLPSEDQLPYQIDGINIFKNFHDSYHYDSKNKNYILGVTNVIPKEIVFNFFYENYNIIAECYCNIIPNGAYVSQTVSVKYGLVLNYGCVIAPYAKLGNFVTVNRNSSIGHHTTIGDFVTINPGVNIAGNCDIGSNTMIGIGVNIIDGKKIGKNCIIGAGSVVTKDLPDNVVAYGVPAKIIRKN